MISLQASPTISMENDLRNDFRSVTPAKVGRGVPLLITIAIFSDSTEFQLLILPFLPSSPLSPIVFGFCLPGSTGPAAISLR
eukprot:g13078.t1